MKAVILAGGLGTRISEETHLKPKPMVEIGGKSILWHILLEQQPTWLERHLMEVTEMDMAGLEALCHRVLFTQKIIET